MANNATAHNLNVQYFIEIQFKNPLVATSNQWQIAATAIGDKEKPDIKPAVTKATTINQQW